MTEPAQTTEENIPEPQSLTTSAARNLTTTTKTVPQMQAITTRWLLKTLPWTQVTGGTYRVNRRQTYTIGDGIITFTTTGNQVTVIPAELTELPPLRGFTDTDLLTQLATQFTQQDFTPGETLTQQGQPADRVILIAHGRITQHTTGKYDTPQTTGVLADGMAYGSEVLTEDSPTWQHTLRSATSGTLLSLPAATFAEYVGRSPALAEHLEQFRSGQARRTNDSGEATIETAAGHEGETTLPTTYASYEQSPREYELSVAQTVLRIHTRVADLYNHPMNQLEQQLRLTIEALRERQEHELMNNTGFGLLHNADLSQRTHTHSGPPTPDDMDELLSLVWKKPSVLLAHPKAIAAFGRQCTKRGIYPTHTTIADHQVPAWRGIPLLPCNKIPVTEQNTSTILAMRTGEQDQGVVGLHQTGIPDEYQPSLSVRFMHIDNQAIMSYLVSAYYSVAVLVPDALGLLQDVQVGQNGD